MKPYPGAVGLGPLQDNPQFQRFLNDFYAMRRRLGGRRRQTWEPRTDVYETDAHIVIKVAIPGVAQDQLAVKVNGEVITICGYRPGPDPGTVRAYHQMEIHNGYFERRIVLHKPFDPNGATARYTEGFLYVHVPKAPELVRHVLAIRVTL